MSPASCSTVNCDFNTKVKANDLCAKIDPRPFQSTVDQADANLKSAMAQLGKDQANLAYTKTGGGAQCAAGAAGNRVPGHRRKLQERL